MIKEFICLMNRPFKTYYTKVPAEHLRQLDSLINHFYPPLRSQFGNYIHKLQKRPIAIKKNNCPVIDKSSCAHIIIGENEYNSKKFRLSTCLHKYKDNIWVEIPPHQLKEYSKCDYLICANDKVYVVLDMNRLYRNSCVYSCADELSLYKKLLPQTFLGRNKNFWIQISDLFDKNYIKSFGYYDNDDCHYEGFDQNGNYGVCKLEYKSSFGKTYNTKLPPKNFLNCRVQGAGKSAKYIKCKVEMCDSVEFRSYSLYSTLRSIFNELKKSNCSSLKSYFAFAKVCRSASAHAKNGTVGQRPIMYDQNGVHYVVFDNSVNVDDAFDYLKNVRNKYNG